MPKKLSVRTDGRTDRPTIIYKLEAQKLWMGIRRSRFKVYLLKSRIDLLEKKTGKSFNKHQRYGEIRQTCKNSQKPANGQSDYHCCLLQTTGNLILISLTEKISKIGP